MNTPRREPPKAHGKLIFAFSPDANTSAMRLLSAAGRDWGFGGQEDGANDPSDFPSEDLNGGGHEHGAGFGASHGSGGSFRRGGDQSDPLSSAEHNPRRCPYCRRHAASATTVTRPALNRIVAPQRVSGVDFWQRGIDPRGILHDLLYVLDLRHDFLVATFEEYSDLLGSQEVIEQRRLDALSAQMRSQTLVVFRQVFPHLEVRNPVLPVGPFGQSPDRATAATVVATLSSLQERLQAIVAGWTCAS